MEAPIFKISEIFWSFQGEGCNVGMPAVFVRLSGCDLECPFCDEGGMLGSNPNPARMTAVQIREEVRRVSGKEFPNVIFTGGEPTMHMKRLVEQDALEDAFEGFYTMMESNGHFKVPSFIDWLTVSPKDDYFNSSRRDPNEFKFLMESTGEIYGKEFGLIFNLEDVTTEFPDTVIIVQPLTYDGNEKRSKMATEHALDLIKSGENMRLGTRLHVSTGER